MYKGRRVCVVVPAFNERERIAGVIEGIPGLVDWIVVVDDASRDDTYLVARGTADPRVVPIRHERNTGVGGAVVTGHRKSLELGADISVVMAGDGQMDPSYVPSLLDALVEGRFDFAKGNRFATRGTLQEMPRQRVWGNAILTLLTKLATGYWSTFDPQNGYTAITRETLEAIPLDRLRKDYLFENSLLWELGLRGFRIKDVTIPAVYRGQKSGIRGGRFGLRATGYLVKAFWGRIFRKYVLRDFHPVALFYVFGLLLALWGFVFGLVVVYWSVGPETPSTGTVMLSVIPFFLGVQLLLSAVTTDIALTPK